MPSRTRSRRRCGAPRPNRQCHRGDESRWSQSWDHTRAGHVTARVSAGGRTGLGSGVVVHEAGRYPPGGEAAGAPGCPTPLRTRSRIGDGAGPMAEELALTIERGSRWRKRTTSRVGSRKQPVTFTGQRRLKNEGKVTRAKGKSRTPSTRSADQGEDITTAPRPCSAADG